MEAENSRQRKVGVILSYVSIAINTIIQLLYTPFLIRMLGQSEYGLYSLAISIIGYLTVLDLGFGNALIVYTAKYREKKEYRKVEKLHGMFKIIFIIIGIIASIIGLILYFASDAIFVETMTVLELQKTKIMLLILSFNLFVTFAFTIYSSIISAHEKFVFQKIMSIISSVMKPILMIPLLFMGYKSIAMCLIVTIVNIAVFSSNYLYCKQKLKINIKYQGFDKTLFKKIMGYSIWVFLAVIVDRVNWSLDNFILGAVSGTIAVSIYSIAATLNHLFISLSTAISNVLLPKMSKLVANKASSEELTTEMIKVGRIQYYVIFLMGSGLVLFGKKFINVWVGSEFIESYYVALILVLPVCIPLIQNIGISILQAMNRFKFKAISTFIMSIFNVIISVLLAKRYGAIGAAFGTAISLIICNVIIINIYYYKKIKINVFKFWKNILSMTCMFFVPFVLILFIKKTLIVVGIWELFIYIPIYCLIYFVISYSFVMNEYEKNIVKGFVFKWRKKNNA